MAKVHHLLTFFSKFSLVVFLVNNYICLAKSDFIVQNLHPDSACATEPVHYYVAKYGNICTKWNDTSTNSQFYGKMIVTSVSSTEIQTEGTKYDDAACTTNPQSQTATVPLKTCSSLPNGWSSSYSYFVERPNLASDKSHILQGGYDTQSHCTTGNYDDYLVVAVWLLDGCIPVNGSQSAKFTASGNVITISLYSLPDCIGTESIKVPFSAGVCNVDEALLEYPSTTFERTNLFGSLNILPATKGGKDGKDAKGGKDGKDAKEGKDGKDGPKGGKDGKDAKGGKDGKDAKGSKL